MPEYLTKEEAFRKCKIEGKFIVVEGADMARIMAMLTIADGDVEAAEIVKKNSGRWNSIYKLYYDALHVLVEAFLQLEKIKIDNHQCLFAYLCEKHPELYFNWEFFEKARTKMNGINYYGTPVDSKDWKEVEIPFRLYIKKLQDEIKKKLKVKST